ncbi:MAG: hypothetical protein ABSA78_01395 [Candidatus Sulfotelmatobacter sp.]|jgi:hypothetical protein
MTSDKSKALLKHEEELFGPANPDHAAETLRRELAEMEERFAALEEEESITPEALKLEFRI